MKFRILALFTALLFSFPALAQEEGKTALPQLPDPIQNLVNEGAQIRYLGNDHGLDAWITIKNGKEQYFYVLPDKKAFLMGVMFDNTGKLVTVEQVSKLREQGDELLDILADDYTPAIQEAQSKSDDRFEFKSPSEQLYYDIENSNWIPLGQRGAPVMYAFIDPQCPHCHNMIEDLRGTYLDSGRVQLRIIPIGFREETRAQAAFLLASPDPASRLYRYLDGEEDAIPAKTEINQQGVQRNLALMQSWKFDATPMVIYRDQNGKVQIVRGRPQNVDEIVEQLGSRQ